MRRRAILTAEVSMRAFSVSALFIVAIVAIAAITRWEPGDGTKPAPAPLQPDEVCAGDHDRPDAIEAQAATLVRAAVDEAARATGEPVTRDAPIHTAGQFRVNCATVDGGAPTPLCTPMDGGTAGTCVAFDTLYVAPVTGASIKVRVGFGSALGATGYEVGPSARDGAGRDVPADPTSDPRCKSVGAAQQVDVIYGRR